MFSNKKLHVFVVIPQDARIYIVSNVFFCLTLSWRRSLSYRNQSIDLLCKSMDWFLNGRDLRHERVEESLYWNQNNQLYVKLLLETGLPSTINRSIIPKFNSLVFFEVTEKSFHQVSFIWFSISVFSLCFHNVYGGGNGAGGVSRIDNSRIQGPM